MSWSSGCCEHPYDTQKRQITEKQGYLSISFFVRDIHPWTYTHTHTHKLVQQPTCTHSQINEKSTYTQDCVIYFIYSSGAQSQVQAPQGFLEWIPRGPQRKGESFIFTVIPAISKTMTECTTILVMGFVQFLYIKDLKEKFLSVRAQNLKKWESTVSFV